MACIDPITFEAYLHSVKFKPVSFTEWHEVTAWCDENIGGRNSKWIETGAEMQLSNAWHFKSEKDAILFALRWGR